MKNLSGISGFGGPVCLLAFLLVAVLLAGNQASQPVVAETDAVQSVYENGPFVNSPLSGAGGADESILQSVLFGMSTYGYGHQVSAGFRVADDFTVTDANGWDVESFTFYSYQTGSSTTSTITAVNFRIWDGVPDAPGSMVIFGDTVTNRLAGSYWTSAYRVTEPNSGAATDRPIMAVVASVGGIIHLAPGTYWVDWQMDGSLASGPWAVPLTVWGQHTTGNALQYTGAWAAVLDGGTGTQQGFPFAVNSVPPHDLFTNARHISTLPYLNQVTTTSGSTSVDDPIYPCGSANQGNISVWYRYTPSADTSLVVHTNGSTYVGGGTYDTMLAVWTGTAGSLTNVACDDDSGLGWNSYLEFSARAGTTYYIEVATFNAGPGGDLKFSVIEADEWLYRGPERPSPSINELTIDSTSPNTVYAATTEGVYKSTNGGSSWTAQLNGLGTFGGLEVTNLVISPASAQTVYISTWGDGVYKSTDGGNNWTLLRSLPEAIFGTAATLIDGEWVHQAGGSTYTLRPRPQSEAAIIADTSDQATINPKQDMDVTVPLIDTSDDSRIPLGIDWVPARYLAVHPTNGNRLIAAVAGWGFYITQNGGDSWTALDMPGATLASGRAIAFSPSSPNIAYASRGDWGANGGIFRSTNGGQDWTMVGGNATVTNVVTHFAVHPNDPNTVLAATYGQGVMITTDGGEVWNTANTGLGENYLHNIEYSPVDPNIIFVTGDFYVWKSVDGGAIWARADSAFPGFNTWGLAVHPSDSAVAYVGSQQTYWRYDFPVNYPEGNFYFGGGVYKSADTGTTFVRQTSGMQKTYVLDMEADPLNPMMVYAGTWGSGIFRSMDGGKTWAQANKGLFLPFVYALEATTGPGLGGVVLYAGTFYSNWAVFESYDQGVSWQPTSVTNLPPSAWSIFDIESRTGSYDSLALATADGIYVSNDAGANWYRALVDGANTEKIILDIERVPGVTDRLVAATYGDGVYYSSNTGYSWATAIGEPSTLVYDLSHAPDAAQGTHVYAANAGVSAYTGGTVVAGLSRSIDGGVTWEAVDNEALVGLSFRSIDHALADTGDIFAGSVGQGMWVSPDYSGKWFHMTQGFTPSRVRSVDANFSAPDKLFVGTDGQGAWWFHMVQSPTLYTINLPAVLKP